MTPQRKLGFEIAGLLAILIAVMVLLEWSYKTYVTGPDQLISEFTKKKSKSEILWLGNSHTLPFVALADEGDRDTIFSSLAYGGIDLFWTQILLKKYVGELPNLKLILVGIDEDQLGYNQSVFGVEYGNRAFYRYTDTLYKDTKTERILASSNFFRSNRDFSHLFGSAAGDSSLNSPLQNTIYTPYEAGCRQRAVEHSEIRFSDALIQENKKCLQEIIALAEQKNIQLIFFIPPKSNCYLQFRNQLNINYARTVLDSVLQGANIALIDLDEVYNFPDSLFRDPDHLNRKGTEIGLNILLDDILKIDSSISKLSDEPEQLF